jgi:hypothetical protein
MPLAQTGSSDAIGASLAGLARDGGDILTSSSDPGDLLDLARAAGVHIEPIPV